MKNIVYNCDCMEYMSGLPDKIYDLAICDIQYGINQGGDKNHTRGALAISKNYHSFDDTKSMPKEYHNELRRISKNQILFGANHFIDNIPHSKNSSCWIVWDKENGKTNFADCELAWTSFDTATRLFKFRWNGMLQGKMGKSKEQRIHPAQKPVDLYKWLLKNYAKPGQTIFDSHVGSGSSRIACHDMGFDFEGCELEKEYWAAQENRFKEHIANGELFSAAEYQKEIYRENELFEK